MAGMMPVPDDGTWRTQSFRQNMVSKIEEARTHCGAPTTKTAIEMENQVFSKANSKNEYLSFVARLIIHIKEMGSKPKMGGAGGQLPQGQGQQQGMMGQMNQMNMNQIGMGGQMNPQGMQQQQMNPMSQHQQQMNMNQQSGMMNIGQQGGGVMNMGQQQSIGMNMGQQGGTMIGQQGSGMNIPQQTMGQPGGGGGINMPPQSTGMSMNQQSGGMSMPPQSSGMGMNTQAGSMMSQPQGVMNIPQQQTPQGVQQSMQINSNQMINQNFMSQGQMQQQQQQIQNPGMGNNVSGQLQSMQNPQVQQMQQNTMFQQQANQPSQQGQITSTQQQIMAGRAAATNVMPGIGQNRMMGPQNPLAQMPRKAPPHRPMGPNAMGNSRPEHGPNYAMNRVNYYGSNITQVDGNMANQFSGPGGPQMQRPGSAGGQFMPPNSSPGMQMGPTPSPNSMGQGQGQPGFVNSPQPPNMLHPSHGSPAGGGGPGRPFSNQMVPSPNTNLNTPMPMAPTPSPRNANPEDLACMEKIKELKKYTDLLQRMIAKIGNEDVEKSSKMKKLLEILTNPNQRVSMEILLKCEAALKKMEKQQHDAGGVMAPASQPMPTKDQISPFQQIQDAILTTLKNGSSSHTFLRTFRPTIEAITGQSAGGPESSDEVDSGYFDDPYSDDFPSVLRRELKIMDNRFHIRMNKGKNRPTPLQLIATLADPKLPRVPPLKIHISADYPDESPSVIDLRREYGSTPLLSSVAEALKSRLLYLPEKFTVIELLNCWEMSVRQVSNPHQRVKKPKLKRLQTHTGRLMGSFL